MEAAEVNEGVGAQEEVGNDGRNGVELSCRGKEEKSEHRELSCILAHDGTT